MSSYNRKSFLMMIILLLISCSFLNSQVAETPTNANDFTEEAPSDLSCLNVDGFACAASMAINLIITSEDMGGNFSQTKCDDIGVIFKASLEAEKYKTLPNMFLTDVRLFLADNDLPVSLKFEESLDYDDLLSIVSEDKIPIAVVQAEGMVHAIVIVGYDINDNGIRYLDSLSEWGDILANELNFQQQYDIQFTDAWKYTFIFDKGYGNK
jgi:hypothetical protein